MHVARRAAMLLACGAAISAPNALAADAAGTSRPAATQPARVSAVQVLREPDAWYRTEAGRGIVDNIVSWQNANGGWWKNLDYSRARPEHLPPPRTDDAPVGDTEDVWHQVSTFDNDATHTELRVVARAHRLLGGDRYAEAFVRGIEYCLSAQYANGGWPQRFPLQENYGRHITFNDDAMTGVMRLLRDVAAGKGDYAFVSADLRKRCGEAFGRGVKCILECQIRVNGKLTAWCQQHDEVTFAPAGARAFELPAITGDESALILSLLMEIPDPDEKVRAAIEAGVAWYRSAEVHGLRVERVSGPQYMNGRDVVAVEDPAATEPLWARFYDIDSGRPFFCGRDGIKLWLMAEVPWERRVGYRWYGDWGKKVYAGYEQWKKRMGEH